MKTKILKRKRITKAIGVEETYARSTRKKIFFVLGLLVAT